MWPIVHAHHFILSSQPLYKAEWKSHGSLPAFKHIAVINPFTYPRQQGHEECHRHFHDIETLSQSWWPRLRLLHWYHDMASQTQYHGECFSKLTLCPFTISQTIYTCMLGLQVRELRWDHLNNWPKIIMNDRSGIWNRDICAKELSIYCTTSLISEKEFHVSQ